MINVRAAIVALRGLGFAAILSATGLFLISLFLIVVTHDPAVIYTASGRNLSLRSEAARPYAIRESYRFRRDNSVGALSQLVLTR
jgi:hypothetical protein